MGSRAIADLADAHCPEYQNAPAIRPLSRAVRSKEHSVGKTTIPAGIWEDGCFGLWLAFPIHTTNARCMTGGCQLVWKKSTPRTKSNATASRHPIFAIVGSMDHRVYHTQHTGPLHAHASQTGVHIRTQPGQAAPRQHFFSPPARGFAHILPMIQPDESCRVEWTSRF
jgi:hypothetical protein